MFFRREPVFYFESGNKKSPLSKASFDFILNNAASVKKQLLSQPDPLPQAWDRLYKICDAVEASIQSLSHDLITSYKQYFDDTDSDYYCDKAMHVSHLSSKLISPDDKKAYQTLFVYTEYYEGVRSKISNIDYSLLRLKDFAFEQYEIDKKWSKNALDAQGMKDLCRFRDGAYKEMSDFHQSIKLLLADIDKRLPIVEKAQSRLKNYVEMQKTLSDFEKLVKSSQQDLERLVTRAEESANKSDTAAKSTEETLNGAREWAQANMETLEAANHSLQMTINSLTQEKDTEGNQMLKMFETILELKDK